MSEVSHEEGVLQADRRWQISSRLVAPYGPLWDHSSTDGGEIHYMELLLVISFPLYIFSKHLNFRFLNCVECQGVC